MEKEEIERYLEAFDRTPAAVRDRLPPKRTPGGVEIVGGLTAFAPAAIASGGYVLQRDGVRARVHASDGGGVVTVADLARGKAPIKAHDRAEDVVDVLRYDRPAEMDAQNLAAAALTETPWSDNYWPVYLGVLGNRYADTAFPGSDTWKENHDYVVARPASAIVATGAAAALDALAPAEKYDLLVGDRAGTLTAAMWAQGQGILDAHGKVETWMGICHGWSPASYMLGRPRRAVAVVSPDGAVGFRFFPSDIKALASLLWASSAPAVRFIGTRCDDKDPARDENGRTLSDACFDTNPGTWHLAVVNQIGVARRAFVMDATYDYQVWNQPICGYEYHYFNPQQMTFAPTLAEALVPRADFTRDRFTRHRSAGYAAVAGVAMRVRYVAETRPSHAETDDPGRDRLVLVDYFYDLELDRDGRIVGGEWYVNRHPDFLFSPARGERAVSPADAFATGAWGAGRGVPASWQGAAVRASAVGMPLARVVERLITLAGG